MTLPPPAEDRAALVTGASSGIGEAIARELARRGHQVVLVARRVEQLEGLADELGARAHPLPADLSVRTDRAALPGRVAALGVTVDILVNNAGLSTIGPIAKAVAANELNLVEVDVAAVVDLCCRLVPGMVERGRGTVLNVASMGAFGPLPGQASYGAAKAFVLSYTETLRGELRGSGVTATTLCPGPVKTDFGEAAGISDEDAEAALPQVMWKTADEVARAGIDGLAAGKGVVVPGGLNRVAGFFTGWRRGTCWCRCWRQSPGSEERLTPADEVEDVLGDDLGLLELKEMAGVVDEVHVAAGRDNVLYPPRVSGRRAAVVAAVQVQGGQQRCREPVLVQPQVSLRRPAAANRRPVGASAARQPSGVPIAASTCRRSSVASRSGDHCRHSRGPTQDADRSGSNGSWKYMMYQLRTSCLGQLGGQPGRIRHPTQRTKAGRRRHRHDHRLAKRTVGHRGQPGPGDRAPIVADDHIAPRRADRVEHPQRIVHERADVIARVGRDRRRRVPARERRHHPPALGGQFGRHRRQPYAVSGKPCRHNATGAFVPLRRGCHCSARNVTAGTSTSIQPGALMAAA